MNELGYNPMLKSLVSAAEQAAGTGRIEHPGQGANLVWQTRSSPPTAHENALGDALEQAFAGGAQTLTELVTGLNAHGSRDAQGQAWSEASFEAEMARLGA